MSLSICIPCGFVSHNYPLARLRPTFRPLPEGGDDESYPNAGAGGHDDYTGTPGMVIYTRTPVTQYAFTGHFHQGTEILSELVCICESLKYSFEWLKVCRHTLSWVAVAAFASNPYCDLHKLAVLKRVA